MSQKICTNRLGRNQWPVSVCPEISECISCNLSKSPTFWSNLIEFEKAIHVVYVIKEKERESRKL